jgi:hypothetical protein
MTALCPNCSTILFYPQGGYRELVGAALAGGADSWVQFMLWGAGGAGTGGWASQARGYGAYVSGVLRVSGDETLRIIAGSSSAYLDGDCGGRSAIQRNVSGAFCRHCDGRRGRRRLLF